MAERKTPWFLWPFVAVWEMLAFILKLTGRLFGIIMGLLLMMFGMLLTVTVVAAPIGIPLLILGFLILLRAIF